MPNKQDIRFAQKMLKHHEQAVEMAQKQIELGSAAEMRKMARKMLNAQTKEIDALKAWLKANDQPQTPSKT